MSTPLTEAQRDALAEAVEQQHNYGIERGVLYIKVRDAIEVGVPVNTLARALGVSRTRIRTLAR